MWVNFGPLGGAERCRSSGCGVRRQVIPEGFEITDVSVVSKLPYDLAEAKVLEDTQRGCSTGVGAHFAEMCACPICRKGIRMSAKLKTDGRFAKQCGSCFGHLASASSCVGDNGGIWISCRFVVVSHRRSFRKEGCPHSGMSAGLCQERAGTGRTQPKSCAIRSMSHQILPESSPHLPGWGLRVRASFVGFASPPSPPPPRPFRDPSPAP